MVILASRKSNAIEHVDSTPGRYRPDFIGWLSDNWPIYEEFERLALSGLQRAEKNGRPLRRLSANFLFEMIRWNTALSEHGPYKLNNVFRPDCALLFDALNPRYAGRFEYRRRTAV